MIMRWINALAIGLFVFVIGVLTGACLTAMSLYEAGPVEVAE